MQVTRSQVRRSGVLAAAAALAVSIAGLQAWAGQPPDESADGWLYRLAQAQQDPGAEAAAQAEEGETEEMPEFTEEVLEDPEVIAVGEEVWQSQCRACHGRAAYPGKAPKLRPSRYDPEFVFDRVTYGFRGMPAWKDVFSREERIAVTAYVLSDEFSP